MKLIITKDKKEAARKVALIIAGVISKKPGAVFLLATGSTMIPLYKELVQIYRKNKIDFSRVKTFNLDEYAGLKFNDKNSYHAYMSRNLFDRVNIQKCNTYFPSSNGKRYDEEIKKSGGVDLCILGIGVNGHIAFNEPGSSFKSTTRRVRLSASTIKANSRFFSSMKNVPKEAYTVGIKTIMKSRKIILIAFGTKKADAVCKTVKGKVSEKVPASALKNHKNTILVIDKNASKKL